MSMSPKVWYDVTDTVKSDRHTGIQRVVVELGRELTKTGNATWIRFDPWTGWFVGLKEWEIENCLRGHQAQAPIFHSGTSLAAPLLRLWKRWKNPLIPSLVQPLARAWNSFRPRVTRARLSDGIYLTAEILGDAVRARAVLELQSNRLLQLALVVYDWLPAKHPEWTALDPHDFERHLKLVRRAALLIAISNATKDDAEAELPLSGARVLTAYPGLSLGISQPATPPAWPGYPRFFVCVGTVEDRKNQRGVLAAFKNYRESGGQASLVVVGRPGRGASVFASELDQCLALGYPILWLKAASDAEILWLYKNALASVYVSFAEGYGLPLLESLGYGTPCITSRGSSTGELAEAFGGCIVVDPNSPFDLGAVMQRFDAEPGLRDNLIETVRHPLPTWESFANAILEGLS